MSFSPGSQPSPSSPDSLSHSLLKKLDPRRLYSAIILLPLLYVLIRYTPPWAFALLIGVASILALWEYFSLYFGRTYPVLPRIVSGIGAALLLLALYEGYLHAINPWLTGLILVTLAGFMYSPATMKHLLSTWSASVFGILYISLFLGHFILLRQMDQGISLVFFVLLITWLADTGGFVVGLSYGRRALAPMLSPRKTIEGYFGGVAFSVIGALLSHFWFIPFFSVWECAILGLVIASVGTVGDLGESAIKRSVSIKDSGTLIPGHGGLLDRVDSLLLTGPALYYYVLLTSPA